MFVRPLTLLDFFVALVMLSIGLRVSVLYRFHFIPCCARLRDLPRMKRDKSKP